jgi:hypothetical protein
MGWMRTLLLGDIGNRLDIADTEREIDTLRRAHRDSARSVATKSQEITRLRDELGRQKLAVEALTRFLVVRKVINQEDLAEFIAEVDAEDGVVDGKLAIDGSTKRLRFVPNQPPVGKPEPPHRRY